MLCELAWAWVLRRSAHAPTQATTSVTVRGLVLSRRTCRNMDLRGPSPDHITAMAITVRPAKACLASSRRLAQLRVRVSTTVYVTVVHITSIHSITGIAPQGRSAVCQHTSVIRVPT